MRKTTTEGRFAEIFLLGGGNFGGRGQNGGGGRAGRGARQAGRLRSPSIFVRHHQGDGGLRVVNVECAASGNHLHEPRWAVVVFHIHRNGQAANAWASAENRKASHPYNIPQAASFVLAGDAVWRGDVAVIHGASQENGEFDSRFGGAFGNVHLHTVGDGLRSRVTVNDFAKQRFEIVRFHIWLKSLGALSPRPW